MNKGERTNILTQLSMTQDDWSYTATVFTVGFIISEVPSNLLLKWSGPRVSRLYLPWYLWAASPHRKTTLTLLTAALYTYPYSLVDRPGVPGGLHKQVISARLPISRRSDGRRSLPRHHVPVRLASFLPRVSRRYPELNGASLLCWYRPDEIGVRMACIGLLGLFSGVISALLAYGFST